MDVVDNILARDVLIDGPPRTVGLTVEEPGIGVVEEPGKGVLDVDG